MNPSISSELSVDNSLLDRYIAGECTSQEALHVQRWLSDQPAMRSVVAQLRSDTSYPDVSADSHGQALIDVDWARVQASMNGAELPAAALLTTEYPAQTVAAPLSPDVRTKQELSFGTYLRSKSRVPLFRRPLAIAAITAVVLLAVSIQVLGPMLSPGTNENQIARTFVTRAGERATVNLADGSYVMLGPLSTMTVTQEFGQGNRTVTLRGSGFFSVAQNNALPFIVDAGRARVQVLGTSFGVRSYAGEQDITIAVRSGRIAIVDTLANTLRSSNLPPLVASANEVVRLDPTGSSITRRAQEVENILAWTEGRLVFRNVPLRTVLDELSRWYDMEFHVTDPSLETLPITGGFSSPSADELPEALSFILPVRISQTGRVITISPRE